MVPADATRRRGRDDRHDDANRRAGARAARLRQDGGRDARRLARRGPAAEAVTVLDPAAPPALAEAGCRVNAALPAPGVVVLAVKPQMMADALPQVAPLAGPDTAFLSIAAGLTLGWFAERLAPGTPIVRAMPNTPAAVGRGVTALIANAPGEAALPMAEALCAAVGETVRLETEDQMDAVTALSGGGPAYVFHLIEAMAEAGEAAGLPPALAMTLARATVCGAGELAHRAGGKRRDPARQRHQPRRHHGGGAEGPDGSRDRPAAADDPRRRRRRRPQPESIAELQAMAPKM
jgi:pyrroline-5-carboxylate reductase